MNLKEIQDNAPEGATHYYMQKGAFLYYMMKYREDWYRYSESSKIYGKLMITNVSDAKPLYPTKEPKNPTNPSHYKQGKVECIDAIESAVVGKKGIEASLVGNIIKYLWRYEEKNGVEDIEKAKWYLDKLLDIMHK